MSTNLNRLRARMSEEGLAALFVTDPANVQWLTGFTGSAGYALVTPQSGLFLTDGRYTVQAAVEVRDLPVRTYQPPRSLTELISEAAAELAVTQLGFEQSITYMTWSQWKDGVAAVEWVPAPAILKGLRMVKTADEVARIKEACKVTDAALEHASRMLQPGVREYDICLDIDFFIRRQGAAVAFDTIVVSGPNSARPHGKPGERALEKGDFVTIDMGARLDGYCSDITRTFVIGEADTRHREIYDAVLLAQVAACNALVPGITGKAADAVARDILGQAGLAEYFSHGLGHGLGRAVHDPGSLSTASTDTVEVGNVWTVEPGVYIEGYGGVRIEDDVHVTDKGPEILTSFPKELMVLA